MAEKPALSETFPNGAGICWLPALRKYAIIDFAGELHGLRNNVDTAREFARGLPGAPHEEPKPAPTPRSPHALPQPEVKYLPNAVPRDERVDFFETFRTREPRVMTPFEKSRAKSRRQYETHDRRYGRHMGRR